MISASSLRRSGIAFVSIFIVLSLTASAAGSIILAGVENSGYPSMNDLFPSANDVKDDFAQIKPASTISLVYTFSEPYVYNEGYDRVEMDGLHELDKTGEPVLPFYTARVLIPPGAKVTSTLVTPGEAEYIPGDYKVEPAGEHVPLTELTEADMHPDLLEPDEAIYSSGEPYPGIYSELVGTERFRGYDIAIVNLFPVQYIPAKGQLYYFEQLTLDLKYSDASFEDRLASNFREFSPDMSEITEIVDNPGEIENYDSYIKTDELQPFTSFPRDLNATAKWDMVIITNDEMNASVGANFTFQDLADHRNANGVKTTIVTVENITVEPAYWNTTNAKFNDTAAQIRNFIIDAYNSWGITYVLLGGDGDGKDVGGESGDNIIPGRGLYCSGDQVPADLYYAGLDGNWNADGDDNWGEYPTETDLMAEIYIGRAPVDSWKEVENFVRKTLHYETTNDSYLDKTLMSGEFLWAPDTYGGDYMDELVTGSDNHGYSNVGIPHDIYYPEDYEIDYIYDRDWANHNWPKSAKIALINEDQHVIHHLGHSNTLYTFKMSVGDVAKLNNTEYFFGYSQGCYPGAFDNRGTSSTKYYTSDSIVEHFIVDEFGAFAFVANSRYGYGMRGSTNGASQRFHRQFVDALYGEDMRDLGRANADSKHDNIGYAGSPVNLWCLYESNLFGDPSTFLRGPKPADHDISVPVMTAPDHVAPNTKIYINTTVLNKGFCSEADILVNFTVDGSLMDNYTIPFLSVGQSVNLSFNWTPVMGLYNIAIEALPAAVDNFLQNNKREKTVIVEPDVAVTNGVFDPIIWLEEPTTITATVSNIGMTTVNNIKVLLLENGVERYNDTITTLAGSGITDVNLFWTPQIAGDRDICIFAQNQSDEHSVADNYYNKSITVKVHPEIDHNPVSFDLTVAQADEKTVDLTLYNNGTSELIYDVSDYSTNGQHRKIALISDRIELLNLTDTMDELGLTYTIYNNNTWDRVTDDYDILKQYGLIIFYSASRALSLNEKLAFDRYLTEHGGNLIVSGYDSLGSPTDYNLAYVVRSQYAYDGPWFFECKVTDGTHPITNGPFGKLANQATFDAANFDHDRAIADPDRGSRAIVTVSNNVKILVTDSVEVSGAKIAYWNGNRFTTDWDKQDSELEMLLKNMLVWAADDNRYDWLTESPTSGSLDINNNKIVKLTVNTSQLDAGTYCRNIVIASNDTDEPDVLIPVKLTIPTSLHDIVIKDMSAPTELAINENGDFNATLENAGTSAESGITVKLLLDSVEVASTTVPSLAVSGNASIGFSYAPNSSISTGAHDLSIYAVPVANENGIFNNIATESVDINKEAVLVLTPDEPDVRGNFRDVVSEELEVKNTGSELLTAHFGTYLHVLEDEFVSTTLNTSIWGSKSGTPNIVSWGFSEPSGPYSLNLDGTADTVVSVAMNLTNATYGDISFDIQLGGNGYRPRASASLFLDYYASNSTWQNVWERQGHGTYTGYRIGDVTYTHYVVELPADAFHSNFKFRLRASGANNGYDDWLIDDVRLEALASDTWIYTNQTSTAVGPYGAFEKIDLVANLTVHPLGVYYKTLYIKSNNADDRTAEHPVTVTVLGDLTHIHMSQSLWLGTADEFLTLASVGHDINHRAVTFDRYWSTTDPNGTVVAGLYDPGKTGTWKVYCNNSDNSIYNFTTVTISSGNLDRIEIDPGSWSGAADSQVAFVAKGYDEDNNQMIFSGTWSVDDPKGAITQVGLYTAGKVGTWTVRCENTTTGINDTVTVTVTGPCLTNRIVVTPVSVTMTTDDEQIFSAVLYDKYDNVISETPAWTVSGGGSIDASGKFMPDTIGLWTIYASFSGKQGSAMAMVNTGLLASLNITPEEVTLTAGDTQEFTVTGFDADGNQRPAVVTWETTGGGELDNNGKYKSEKAGVWTVYANASGLSASAEVTVEPAELNIITVSPAEATITAGEKAQFTATGYDVYDNEVILSDLKWTSHKGSKVSDIADGLFAETQEGTYEVHATDTTTGKYGKAYVDVTCGDLYRLVTEPAEITVSAGTLIQISVKYYDEYNNPADAGELLWTCTGGGELDDTLQTYTAQYTGKWDVCVKAKDDTSIEATSKITVTPGAVETIEVSPASHEMQAGTGYEFTSKCFDKYGNEVIDGIALTWSEEGGGAFTKEGYFYAENEGVWKIYARAAGKSGMAEVTVTPGRLAKLEITPKDHEMFVGAEVLYKVKGYDEFDNLITDEMTLEWSSDGGGSVDEYGLFKAERVGDWIITVFEDDTNAEATAAVHIKAGEGTDSDGDGMPDLWENVHGLNPYMAGDEKTDPDADSATNLEEYHADTNPNSGDSDGDALSDGWEIDYGLDPLSDTGDNGQTGDPDKDGYNNLAEQGMGTNPKDGSDPAKIDDTSKPTSTGDDKSGITDFIIPLIIIVIIVIVVALMILLRRPKKQKPEGVPEVVPTFEGAPPLMDTPQPPLLQGEVYQPTDPYADPYQGQDLYGEEPRTPYVEPGMVKEEIYPADEVYNDTNRNTDQFFDTAVDPSQQQDMNGTQYEQKRYDEY